MAALRHDNTTRACNAQHSRMFVPRQQIDEKSYAIIWQTRKKIVTLLHEKRQEAQAFRQCYAYYSLTKQIP